MNFIKRKYRLFQPPVLKSKFVKKYTDTVFELLKDTDSINNNLPKKISYHLSLDSMSIEDWAFHKLETTILQYIAVGNGFIGKDYYILRQCTFQLLIHLMILKQEKPHDNDLKWLEVEISRYFYYFLNSIYNIKEKFESFAGCEIKNSKLDFDSSVLSLQGRELINELFIETYGILGECCEVRCELVHGNYNMSYDLNSNTITISLFSFNLSTNPGEADIKRYNFSLDIQNILNIVKSIYNLRNKFYNIIKDRNSIDAEKLLNKFREKDGKTISIKF